MTYRAFYLERLEETEKDPTTLKALKKKLRSFFYDYRDKEGQTVPLEKMREIIDSFDKYCTGEKNQPLRFVMRRWALMNNTHEALLSSINAFIAAHEEQAWYKHFIVNPTKILDGNSQFLTRKNTGFPSGIFSKRAGEIAVSVNTQVSNAVSVEDKKAPEKGKGTEKKEDTTEERPKGLPLVKHLTLQDAISKIFPGSKDLTKAACDEFARSPHQATILLMWFKFPHVKEALKGYRAQKIKDQEIFEALKFCYDKEHPPVKQPAKNKK